MTARTVVRVLLLSFLSSPVFSQAMPSNWTTSTAPKWEYENPALRCANYSRNEWNVSVKDGALEIQDGHALAPHAVKFPPKFVRSPEMKGKAHIIAASDGWFLGFDAGEFGGGLWWSNDDGSVIEKLGEENVQVMLARGDEILVFTGWAHMGMDDGHAYSFRPGINGHGPLIRIANLPSAPAAAFLRSDGSVLIAGNSQIMKLERDDQLKVLYKNEALAMLYPQSIVEGKDGALFVGMRFYVLRLDPARKRDSWTLGLFRTNV